MNKFGPYTIQKELGRGAFGKVYLVYACFSYYAAKKIPIRQGQEQQKIEKEVIALKRLNHVNVVRFVESFSENDAVFVVLEYCNGGDLNSYVLKNPQISTTTLLNFTHQIGRGLEYLHTSNIIHRDIKPDNMMIVNGWFGITVKLADFGLARVWETFDYKSPYYDFQYSPKGPPFYTAPEVFRDRVTVKSDIFSMGCVIMAIYSRQTVPWIDGKKLLAPYIGSAAHQICQASDQQKDEYIKRYIFLKSSQHHKQFQQLVFEMVQDSWRRRPNTKEVLQRVDGFDPECTIL